MNKRKEWAEWLRRYGAENFYDAFMESAQNVESVCVWCKEPIFLDIEEGGGVPDWGTASGVGLDYGCPYSPDTSEEGTGGHKPQKRDSDRFWKRVAARSRR